MPAAESGLLPKVQLSRSLAAAIEAEVGDLVYVTDSRWWLGGLRSAQAVVGSVEAEGTGEDADVAAEIALDPETHAAVVTPRRQGRPLVVERLY